MTTQPDQRSARGALRTRQQAAAFLTEQLGCPTSPRTLEGMVTRGGGPRFRRWGRYALYAEADLIAWAESRFGPTHASTSETT